MEQTVTTKSVNRLSIRYGLLIGAISGGFSIIFYIINPLIQYTNLFVPILSFIVVIALLIILAIDIRKKNGVYWKFGQAYLSLLIMSIFIVLIGIIINFIIIKFVNPTLPSEINDAVMQATNQRLEKFGMDQSQIDEATKQFSNGEFIAKLQPTLFNQIKNFGIALIVYAIIDLILAAIIKKNKPPFNIHDETTYVDPAV